MFYGILAKKIIIVIYIYYRYIWIKFIFNEIRIKRCFKNKLHHFSYTYYVLESETDTI